MISLTFRVFFKLASLGYSPTAIHNYYLDLETESNKENCPPTRNAVDGATNSTTSATDHEDEFLHLLKLNDMLFVSGDTGVGKSCSVSFSITIGLCLLLIFVFNYIPLLISKNLASIETPISVPDAFAHKRKERGQAYCNAVIPSGQRLRVPDGPLLL